MLDPATYDDAEALGHRATANWVWRSMMTSSALEPSSFPMRVRSLQELRAMLDSMHQMRFDRFVAELNGLSEAEIDEVVAALVTFARFHVATFQDGPVPLPLNTLLSAFLASRKLRALPRHASLLEIGPGSGFLNFFTTDQAGFRSRTQVEVTQSLYLLQAQVNAFLYGERYRDLAVTPIGPSGLGTLTDGMRIQHGAYERTPTVDWRPDPVMTQVPWWRVDSALDGVATYDVIVANANLYEMTFGAFVYYFENFRRCLARDGVVLIQDVGARRGTEALSRTDTLLGLGYRPLVHVVAGHKQRGMATENVLLVREGHPLWDAAARDFKSDHLPEDVPLVRAVYGLDRPDGEKITRERLVERVNQSLSK